MLPYFKNVSVHNLWISSSKGTVDRAARSAFFKQIAIKMADEDSHSTDYSVSAAESHSDPLRVAAEEGARLSTPAKAYCEQIYLVTLDKTQKMLRNVAFVVQITYFCIRLNKRREKQNKFCVFSNFCSKNQLLTVLEKLLSNI